MGARHRQPVRPAAVLLMLLIALLTCLQLQADSDGDKRQKLKQLSGETSKLQQLLNSFKSQRSQLQNNLQQSEVAIGSVQQKIIAIQRQLKQEQASLQTLQDKRQTLSKARQEQQKYIEQQVLAAYQVGQQKKIKVLLNQQDPDKVSRALNYYDYFNKARSQQIEGYIDIISEINAIEPQIVEKTTSLANAKQLLSQEHDKLLESKKSRQQSLVKINSAIKSNDQRLRQINKDRAELEELLNAVEQTLASISIPGDFQPFQSLKGKLPWPVKGSPANRFGKARNGSTLRWQGLSIPANEGSTVQAIHHGRIIFSDWLRGSGLLVIIDHGNGYMSLYAHNQSLLKETGDWVNPGDVIATVGNSGGQQSAGLYFEIRYNGKPTDPSSWCKRA
jgi:septal ring factor EnvC (AmiA/AmiB activator)